MTLIEKRKLKYPDTNTFHYYNANPKNRITTDCVIRALSRGMNKPYNDVVMELALLQCETGYDDGDKKLYDTYLKNNGWTKHKQPRKWDNTKYTGEEWCYEVQSVTKVRKSSWDKIIANIGGHHVVAIIDGKVNDIWNSTGGCIGNYWTID